MNIPEQLTQAQDGGAVRQLAEKFNMDETLAQSALRNFLPTLLSDLKKNLQAHEKASNLMDMMQNGNLPPAPHKIAFDQPD